MSLKYIRLDAVIKRLETRLNIIAQDSIGISGITGTSIGTDLITLAGEGIEEFIDIYLGMVYILPLKIPHPFLFSIAERLVCAEVLGASFTSSSENPDGQDNYSNYLRQSALNDFQILFSGLGIFIPDATNASNSMPNDEDKSQLIVKTVFLKGETVKKYIGYDYDEDGLADDLFANNVNIDPSFFIQGDLERGDEPSVINGVVIRSKRRIDNQVVNFW